MDDILMDWLDYNQKKEKDYMYFSCSTPWEVNYLIIKIQAADSTIRREKIIRAIQDCCKSIPSPKTKRTICKMCINSTELEQWNYGILKI
ncbi:hypothetical protein LVD15_22845 [Fulvivirga maritima]|uniref:hypothetical protein n=1 Tax=Fulvivirga maritima TaxID=2904247 RepID=UPI001F476E20|nr:hypothetical protein [Fulvivirga maritima]UII26112.1 hypothetical protein LVD15_22845 [Fulvivirga maritima]